MSPDSALLGEILAAIQGQTTELRSIRQLLERQQQARSSTLSRTDRDHLARLLPAIAGVLGSELFLVRDLFRSDAAGLRLVLRGWNARQVGRLLRRAEGQPIDGHVIRCEGHELGALLWRVVPFP